MSEQLSEKGKDLVRYMPQAVNALADRLIEKLEERLLYGEKPQTNADRIRAMTDEELAEWMATIEKKCYARCGVKSNFKRFNNQWFDWLKSPVEEQDG